MDISHLPRTFRNWLPHLRCCAKLDCPHCRSSSCGYWLFGPVFRCTHHPRAFNAAGEASNIHWSYRWGLWHRERGWPTTRRCIHGSCYLAVCTTPLKWKNLLADFAISWSFYINLPFGTITAFTIILFFTLPPNQTTSDPNLTRVQKIMQFDPIGTVLFLPSVVCVLLALQWGGTKYPWSDGRIVALFVLFAVLLIAFGGVQYWAGENATVPLRIIKQRSIASAAYFSLCVGAAFFITVFYLPIWFQVVRGTTATQSGIDTLPMMISFTLSAIVGGGIVTTYGYYTPFLYALVVIASIGAGLLTTFTVDISTDKWIGYQIILGWGIGIGMQQTLIAAQAVLPLPDVPIGTAVVIFSQMLGGSLFVSVAQNVFTNKLVEGLETVKNLGIDPKSVISTGATDIAKLITNLDILDEVKVVYNDAIVWTFRVALIMICLRVFGALFMEWKSVKKDEQNNKPVIEVSEA